MNKQEVLTTCSDCKTLQSYSASEHVEMQINKNHQSFGKLSALFWHNRFVHPLGELHSLFFIRVKVESHLAFAL